MIIVEAFVQGAVLMWKRIVTAILMVFMLSSCTLKLGYNSLDFWIDYYLSDYLDLNSAQQSQLEQGLDSALAEHRKQILPQFHRLIFSLQNDLKQPLTAEQIAHYHDAFTKAGQASAVVFVAPITKVVKTMGPKQVSYSLQAIQEEISERKKERLSKTAKERLQDRYDELEDKATDWIGRLTQPQKQLIMQLAQLQLQQSTVFQNIAQNNVSQLTKALKQRSAPEFEQIITLQVKNIIGFESSIYQSQLDKYLAQRFEIMRQLNHSLSQQQLQHLQAELTELRKDIAELIQNR
ncbi:hypothetical protein CTM94_02560 [Photobacterium leiognathi]|uniref:Lipoprotein n=2 Tax=Photobacterium leiognathi TaxID=553611 RepID=A0ABX5GK89_PHOLE|nr:hypothetical protein UB42_03830 [Photobacterium leiognathi]PSV86042.1 hypothetical protein CTM94_02560 [Photobacterium leiognathi]